MYNLTTITPNQQNTKMIGISAQSFTVGRHGDFTTPPEHNSVSRLHIGIFRSDFGGFSIRDLNSYTGTRVNMEGIGNQSRQLKDGDIIQLGNTVEVQFNIQ